ncbi:hypothetical protein [Streptomyces sp. NBC_00063]|uniref:hypothetical protein n=1 Tax=Streptomyces sp. NBC_00063 TaxID=2975638 RepID=UPI003D70E1A2
MGRRPEAWGVVRRLVTDGATVLLITQYREEADQLAYGIPVFDRGHVVAEGRPHELKRRVGGHTLQVRPTVSPVPARAASAARLPHVSSQDGRFRTTSVRLSGGRAVAPVSPGARRPLLKA